MTALVFSKDRRRSELWTAALEAQGWDVLQVRNLEDVIGATRLGVEVAVLDLETPAELIALASFGRFVALPPVILRVAALAATADLLGCWRGIVQVGALDREGLLRAIARLRSTARSTGPLLPVRLPAVSVMKWGVRVRARECR